MASYSNPNISGVDSGPTCAVTSTKVMVNDDVLFNITGHVIIRSILSECWTENGATASTLQYKVIPIIGSSTTISGASASLANAAVGTAVIMNGAALSDAPTVVASGVGLSTTARGISSHAGEVAINVGVGSTTGTWRHYIRYDAMEPGAFIAPAF